MPRSSVTASRSAIDGSVGRAGFHDHSDHHHHHHHSAFSHAYWNPCHYDSWSHWHWYGGCGSFGWGVSLYWPWYWHRHYYWNDCHLYSYPYGAGYWWYPSTTYCPTYLAVPSSSVVYIDSGTSQAPAASETIVAGGGVEGSARAGEGSGERIARNEASDDLAKKYVELGDFYFEVGRYTEAADAYARAKSYAPGNASVHFAMADAAFAAGDYHYAAFLVGEAVRLQPEIVSANIDRRAYYAEPKQFDEQMAALDRYLATKPFDAQAHLLNGYNLRFSGKQDAAIAAFRRVLEIAPENRTAPVFLSALAPANSETKR